MRSHFVVVSPAYGGAEKRFFNVFTSLRRSGVDVGLIGPASLLDRFMSDHPDREDVFAALTAVTLARWSRLAFVVEFRKILTTMEPGSAFHYPMNCLWPLHLGRGDRVSMSMVDCGRVPALLGGTFSSAWSWLSFFFVSRIDVLSPAILAAMARYRMAGKMSLTPGGTFLMPPACASAPKSPNVVFLARLVPGKGIDDLLDLLPEIWNLLRDRTPQGFSFEIAGYGPLQEAIAGRVDALARSGIPISFIGYASAETLLARSVVLLSLQEPTNYPSRVVAEAMMAGCGVVVRDTGDSREFGDHIPGLVYCRAKLDARELAEHLTSLSQRVMHEPGFQDAVRSAAGRRFNSRQYVDYFRELMTLSSTADAARTAPRTPA